MNNLKSRKFLKVSIIIISITYMLYLIGYVIGSVFANL